jgi:predicted DNA-binding transcriptional regulator AlpA
MHPNFKLPFGVPRDERGTMDFTVDPLLTDRDAAALLRVGVSTFRRYVAQGLVHPPIKLGGTSRWPRSEILAVIEAAKAQRSPALSSKEGL